MPGVRSKKEQKEVLTAFRRALSQERHNFKDRPEILWQQMYNRLQWEDGENKDGPVTKVVAPELEKRTAPGARPWLHNIVKTRESEALIMVLTGHTSDVNSCAFSPDGKTLASASWDHTVRLWDAQTGTERTVLEGHTGSVHSCAFSPDGKTLATGGDYDKTVRLWDAATGSQRALLEGHIAPVFSCAFSPDGRTLASASWDKTVRLWDVSTGKKRAVLKGHKSNVNSCAFSPDGKTLASASRDKTVRLWDVHTGSQRAVLEGHTDEVRACAFSPDGKTLASASRDKTVRLWDVSTGSQRDVLEDHTGPVFSCAFSPDGKTLASASYDKTVRLWEVDSGRLIYIYPCIGELLAISYSPSGRTIASGDSGGNVYILELHNFDHKQIKHDPGLDRLSSLARGQAPRQGKRKVEDTGRIKRDKTSATAVLPEAEKLKTKRELGANFVMIAIGLLLAGGAYALILLSPWLLIVIFLISFIAGLFFLIGFKAIIFTCPHCNKKSFILDKADRSACCNRKINI